MRYIVLIYNPVHDRSQGNIEKEVEVLNQALIVQDRRAVPSAQQGRKIISRTAHMISENNCRNLTL